MGRLFLKANVIYTLFLDFISKQIYLKKSDFFILKITICLSNSYFYLFHCRNFNLKKIIEK